MPRTVTLDDIAKAARLARSTVSYALRNDPLASPATRARVRAIAEKLGYRPNPLVAALMTHRRGARIVNAADVVAYVTCYGRVAGWRQSPLFVRHFQGARERGAQIGFKVEAFDIERERMSGARFSSMLLARGIRGVIIAPLPRPGIELALTWERFAAAAIGYTLAAPAVHRAAFDHYHGMLLALEKLKEQGVKKVGFAFPERNVRRVDQIWRSVFLLYQADLPASWRVPLYMPDEAEWTREKFLGWFRRHRPEAVVYGGDSPREWLLEAEPEAAGRVRWTVVNHPGNDVGLRGIDQNYEQVGAAALDLVSEQLLHNEVGVPPQPKVVLVKGKWVDAVSA